MKYHINPKTGNPNICRAKTAEACLYYDKDKGVVAPHFDDRQEARRFYEEQNREEYIQNLTKKPKVDEDFGSCDSTGWLDDASERRVKVNGVFCPNCGKPVSVSDAAELIGNDIIRCICTKAFDIVSADVRVTKDNPSYDVYSDPKNVFKQTWFHATRINNDDWEKNIKESDLSVHLGTENAAYDRGITEYAYRSNNTGKDFIIYEVALDESSVVDEAVLDDMNNIYDSGDSDITRYINRWEDMASISLVASSKSFRVVSKKVIKREDARRRISIYNVRPKTINHWL